MPKDDLIRSRIQYRLIHISETPMELGKLQEIENWLNELGKDGWKFTNVKILEHYMTFMREFV